MLNENALIFSREDYFIKYKNLLDKIDLNLSENILNGLSNRLIDEVNNDENMSYLLTCINPFTVYMNDEFMYSFDIEFEKFLEHSCATNIIDFMKPNIKVNLINWYNANIETIREHYKEDERSYPLINIDTFHYDLKEFIDLIIIVISLGP